jgi:hypothetical protein
MSADRETLGTMKDDVSERAQPDCDICGQPYFRHVEICGSGRMCPISAVSYRPKRALTPTPPKGDLCERLLLAIQHGDEEHRAWLRDAIDAFFTGEPVPAPRGGGRKEARIKAMEAENARLREDWVAAAAMYTLDAADAPPARRSGDGDGPEHASWMLHEIVNQRIAGRKAHRWLGYAQGILVAADWLTLEQAKLANKRASDECSLLSTPPEQPVDGEVG